MISIRGTMRHPSMATLATVENLCNILPTWFIQKPKARARCSGLIAVCPESLVPNPLAVCPESLSRIPVEELSADSEHREVVLQR